MDTTEQIMEQVMEQELSTALPKHAYPLYIKLFLFSLPVLFVGVIPAFIWYDLPRHKAMHARIIQAHDAFVQERYYDAVELYWQILEQYPAFKEGRIELIKSCFALSDQEKSDYFYEAGLYCLGGERYEISEIFSMQEYAPRRYRNDFESRFT